MKPPAFKGGQGRTPHDLRRDATSLGLTLLALLAIIVAASIAAWGRS